MNLMANVRIRCAPDITHDITVAGRSGPRIFIGRTRDSNGTFPVYFDAETNFVTLEVGKRGSGKSFGLGAALEAFATQNQACSIATHGAQRRGMLLLDPLDVHWTAIYPLTNGPSQEMREQYRLLERWPEVSVDAIQAEVFMPAGRLVAEDPAVFRPYQIPITDLTPDDLAMLYGTNLFNEPAGMLIAKLYNKITRLGYQVRTRTFAPKDIFGLNDFVACLEDSDIQANFASSTIRAVGQRFRTWLTDPLFQSDVGTSVTTLVRPGVLSILCLNRLPEDLRTVVTGVVVRKIKAERTRASQAERRRAFDPAAPAPNGPMMPRTILAIDEAQMLLPAQGINPARTAIDAFVLEGRNFGLSVWLATQRPRGAVSPRAVSQIDSLIAHRLSSAEDIAAVTELTQSRLPELMRVNDMDSDLPNLLRSLEIGMAVVSGETTPRAFVMEVRPRVVAHGGKAF
jgi:hypothetical protein